LGILVFAYLAHTGLAGRQSSEPRKNALKRFTFNVLTESLQTVSEWIDRYGPRAEDYRMPKSKAERESMQRSLAQMGGDC
jgi:hypothetical protein